jgi:hypothetical protein
MDAESFEKWFQKKFVPEDWFFLKEKKLPQKVVLLLDNAPFHPNDGRPWSHHGQVFSPHCHIYNAAHRRRRCGCITKTTLLNWHSQNS